MRNRIELVLYKGGTIEHSLSNELCIPSLNIENVPQLQKANSHDPKFEVNYHYAQIVGYLYLESISLDNIINTFLFKYIEIISLLQ